jgi:hypothetical protein
MMCHKVKVTSPCNAFWKARRGDITNQYGDGDGDGDNFKPYYGKKQTTPLAFCRGRRTMSVELSTHEGYGRVVRMVERENGRGDTP